MSDTDDLIRRAEDMANVIEYARAARVSPAYTDDTYLRMIRDLLAEVNRLREHLDVLDTDDRVLVRALMAESEAGKAVQRVEALADQWGSQPHRAHEPWPCATARLVYPSDELGGE